ncbi:hypothetical protein [Massilia sp. KIM]|uniref:hypothetical protein n=1 Tax=Massilia sp. KIM TaxID=1955422 RepID=UPI00117CA6DE|nr:hypothetical protein [Massilia sp. KIM]
MFADIAGRVSQARHGADRITAAAVCLPSLGLRAIRKKLPQDLPKWKNADDRAVDLVSSIVREEAFGVGVYSIDKTEGAWEKFWADSASLYSALNGRVSVARAAYQVKCLMSVHSTTIASVNAIKTIGQFIERQTIITKENLVFDREIDGADNIDVFEHIWRRANTNKPLLYERRSIQRQFEAVELKTENEEPLLLLADYIAGLAHAASSTSNVLSASAVTAACAKRNHDLLSACSNYTLTKDRFTLDHAEIWAKE